MLKKYFPTQYMESVFKIDFQKLYDKGYRAILFDVDNTIVHHGDDSNPIVDEWFREVQKIGFKTLLLSDNSKERLERFLKNLDAPYIPEAGKPSPENYFKALQMLGVDKSETICIGDQVFKDILGANRAGIDSILVHFIQVKKHEKIGIRRHIEKVILFFYRLSKYHNRLGDIHKEV